MPDPFPISHKNSLMSYYRHLTNNSWGSNLDIITLISPH